MALVKLPVVRFYTFELAMAERQIIKIVMKLIFRLGKLITTKYWMD